MSDEADTVVSPVLEKAAKNWRKWVPWTVTSIVCLANAAFLYAVAYGHKQADDVTVAANVTMLVSQMQTLTEKFNTQSNDIAGMKSTVGMIHEDVQGFKAWKDRVTGVAETVSVPKLGRRVRKP